MIDRLVAEKVMGWKTGHEDGILIRDDKNRLSHPSEMIT